MRNLFQYRGWAGLLSALLVLTIAACATQAPPPPASTEVEPTSTLAPTATLTKEAEPTAEKAATEETEEEASAEPAATEMAEEEVIETETETAETVEVSSASCFSAQDLIPENPNIAPFSEADWQKGNPEASLTLIEYGDFQ